MVTPLSNDPLSEEELNYLEDILEQYRTEASVYNVSELDGFFAAVLSGPTVIRFDDWYMMLWGAPEYLPEWRDEQEFERFFRLLLQHMNYVATLLIEYPDDFEPLFNEAEVDGEMALIVEDWCFGYMRGMSTGDGWPDMPEEQQQYLSVIIMHTEEDSLLDEDAPLAIDPMETVALIPVAAVHLQQYWRSRRAEFMPRRAEPKVGRNDPCPCGSGRKFKQCCLH